MKAHILPLSFLVGATFVSAQTAITVYNGNFGVVRDTVPLQLEGGLNDVSYSGVTAQLEPESVVLRDPSGEVTLSVVEQSYRGDPVDQMRLLQIFEGKEIDFLIGNQPVPAKIVRAPSIVTAKNQYGNDYQKTLEPIVEMNGQLRTSLPGQPLFPSLGDDSVLLPTLSWKLHSSAATGLDAQLSYLTNGMNWKADYNLVLPEKGDELTLTGWVSIDNNTGKTFDDAKIKLVAGDVNKVQEQPRRYMKEMALGAARADAFAAAPTVEEKKFDEFHMYTLPLPTTLRDRETKQVEFVRAEKVQSKKIYVYDGANIPYNWRYYGGVNQSQNYGQNDKPDVAIYREFKNTEENGLAVPLPAGRTRFYRMDDDGQLEFTGENTIDHTPKNETIRVYLGNAFDLVGERTRTNFTIDTNRKQMSESFEIEVRNRSEETVSVQVVEHLYRWANWKLTKHSHAFEKADAQTVEFPVTLKPDETKAISYTVEYTW